MLGSQRVGKRSHSFLPLQSEMVPRSTNDSNSKQSYQAATTNLGQWYLILSDDARNSFATNNKNECKPHASLEDEGIMWILQGFCPHLSRTKRNARGDLENGETKEVAPSDPRTWISRDASQKWTLTGGNSSTSLLTICNVSTLATPGNHVSSFLFISFLK